ncbi:hypothetical protein V5799_024332 [Amblyomma americanum]|uniref:Uncharacterized protein n=1 Tax=Amblyomma americanum TaxID=6943 RepID=A0AAQ4ECD9_AMBAM
MNQLVQALWLTETIQCLCLHVRTRNQATVLHAWNEPFNPGGRDQLQDQHRGWGYVGPRDKRLQGHRRHYGGQPEALLHYRPSLDEECLSVISGAIAKNPMIQIMGLAYTICSSKALEIMDSLRCNISMMLQAVELVLAPAVSKVEAEAFEMY